MRSRIVICLLALAGAALAAREWTRSELDRFLADRGPHALSRDEIGLTVLHLPTPESLLYGPRRYNYLERIRLMADFVAAYQVSDSLSPEFGGIIESEHQPTVIETDNTQEAIWVWSRWFELTGRNDYAVNIRRAWHYVRNFPAYREHQGNPSSIWYAVWNCGLGFLAEARYRAAYGDSTYRAYADTCRSFYLANALSNATFLDNFVNSQSSGMAYEYAGEQADSQLRDTAVARGARVQDWIEADPITRLASAQWAMSGGTAFWGVARTVCREDTIAGRQWVETYAEYLPGFYPTGNWNCSHNIWLANAYRAAAEVRHDAGWWQYHQYLVDTLLTKDTDRDGGIPATWTDPDTRDQTWISTYLDFMGMDVFVTPTFDADLSTLDFASPGPGAVLVTGDTIEVLVPVANVGLNPIPGFDLTVSGPGYLETVHVDSLSFLGIDTIPLPDYVADSAGIVQLSAAHNLPGDQNPLNDSSTVRFKVYGVFAVTGTLLDSASGSPIHAWIKASIHGDTIVRDSAETDRSGVFRLALIDTFWNLALEPWPPYYRRSWLLPITGDTTVEYRTQPAHLMLVNADPAGAYDGYYTNALDPLGVTWFTWHRPAAGTPPWTEFTRLRTPTVIWFSGDADTGTVPAADRASLADLGESGLNLLLTGQNIAEELAGTSFLTDFVGCGFDTSGWAGFYAFGTRGDSLGRQIPGFATAGGDGANNQRSRDVVVPGTASHSFISYDTVTGRYGGTRRADPSTGTRVLFLGFGFESANRPHARPDFLDRTQLMRILLGWFEVPMGTEEPRLTAPDIEERIQAGPNPCRDRLVLAGSLPPGTRVVLIDVAGRRLRDLRTGSNDISDLAPGIYFLQSMDGSRRSSRTTKVVRSR